MHKKVMNYMNILIAINDEYTFPAQVMLTSLCVNNPGKHDIYLFYTGLHKKNIGLLNNLLKKYGANLHPIHISEDIFGDSPLNSHFSVEIYYRLLVYRLIPDSVDKILWLDADIVVKDSIEELYSIDLQDSYLAACKARSRSENNERLGLPSNHIYFNSGVILFDLNKIRGVMNDDQIKQCISDIGDDILWPDQDVLNVLYLGKTVYFDECFNYQVYNELISRNTVKKNNISVIHYVSSDKPWNKYYSNSFDRYFFKYSFKIKPWFSLCNLLFHRLYQLKESIQ